MNNIKQPHITQLAAPVATMEPIKPMIKRLPTQAIFSVIRLKRIRKSVGVAIVQSPKIL